MSSSVQVGSSKGGEKSIYICGPPKEPLRLCSGCPPVGPVELEPEGLKFGHWCHRSDRWLTGWTGEA
jgi:hypothetical protein